MDAVSFVLGVKASQLRGKQLSDLVHRDSNGNQSDGASVELVYSKADFDEEPSSSQDQLVRFKRTIDRRQSASVYSFQGRSVSAEQFTRHLAEIGIVHKARNCLVFQGDVVQLSLRSPKQITELVG